MRRIYNSPDVRIGGASTNRYGARGNPIAKNAAMALQRAQLRIFVDPIAKRSFLSDCAMIVQIECNVNRA